MALVLTTAKVGDSVQCLRTKQVGEVLEVLPNGYEVDFGDEDPTFCDKDKVLLLNADNEIKTVTESEMNKLLYARTKAAIRAEAELDIDTTIARKDGSTDDGSGSNPNPAVTTNQTAQDAGKTHENPSVNADRLPGEMADGVDSNAETGNPQGVKPGVSGNVTERSVNTGLFAGTFVKVIDLKSGKQVDKGIVRKVGHHTITLDGDETYDQDKYKFIRLA